jgi:alkanesulfonate monooxygenase SsuD/methylene tetrahydromethanopterin reductase-like flavin-dependent oxidoreductase (luciferase family)
MENHGVEFTKRWTLVRESVELMRSLWRNDVAEYRGTQLSLEPSWQWPKPQQAGGPRVHLGGGVGPRLLGEVAAWADGWLPISARASLGSRLALMHAACERVGRDPASVEVSVFGAVTTREGLAALSESGVHRAVLTIWAPDRDGALRDLDTWTALLDR